MIISGRLEQFLTESGFNTEEQAEIAMHFKLQIQPKGSYFVQEGRTNPHLGFIESGIFQYYYNLDGNEITTYVVSEGGFIASLISFLRNMPARESIRALTDSRIWLIHRNDLKVLCEKMPKFQEFYTQLIEYQVICIDDSRFNLITLNAEQRYQKLLSEEPQLLQKIPLQYLASILGITPRHLSRIRRNIH